MSQPNEEGKAMKRNENEDREAILMKRQSEEAYGVRRRRLKINEGRMMKICGDGKTEMWLWRPM